MAFSIPYKADSVKQTEQGSAKCAQGPSANGGCFSGPVPQGRGHLQTPRVGAPARGRPGQPAQLSYHAQNHQNTRDSSTTGNYRRHNDAGCDAAELHLALDCLHTGSGLRSSAIRLYEMSNIPLDRLASLCCYIEHHGPARHGEEKSPGSAEPASPIQERPIKLPDRATLIPNLTQVEVTYEGSATVRKRLSRRFGEKGPTVRT